MLNDTKKFCQCLENDHLPLRQEGNDKVKTLICSLDDGFLGSGVQCHCCHKWRHFSSVRQQTLSQHVTICKTKWNQCKKGSRDRAAVRVLASHKCGPVSNPGIDIITWVEFVVGSLLCLCSVVTVFSASHQKPKSQNLTRNGRQSITLFIEVLNTCTMNVDGQNINRDYRAWMVMAQRTTEGTIFL